jgi:hypothetical protein
MFDGWLAKNGFLAHFCSGVQAILRVLWIKRHLNRQEKLHAGVRDAPLFRGIFHIATLALATTPPPSVAFCVPWASLLV